MTHLKPIEHRLEHVQNIVDTVEDHCADEGDSQALLKAFGLLEAAIFEIEDLREELQESDDRLESNG